MRIMEKFSFVESEADSCIFVGKENDSIVYLALFVDDGIVATKSQAALESVINNLRNAFNVTIGDASMFVGMQIERDRGSNSIFIHQNVYTQHIIEKFNMSQACAMSVPCDPHSILYPVNEDECVIKNVPYREAVGSLMFLAVVSRPDIAYAVNNVSKFLSKHNKEHWQAVKRIFAYLVGTKNVGIKYRGTENIKLVGYSDSDFANDIETRRSTTGYMFELAEGPVTWSSQRQKLVTLSTTEAEYVTASQACKEAIWLKKLLKSMGYECEESTVIYVDNQSAIRLVKNPEYHKRTKHIDLRYHYIREKAIAKEICVRYVSSVQQKADIFNKALPKNRFKEMCEFRSVTTSRLTGESVDVKVAHDVGKLECETVE